MNVHVGAFRWVVEQGCIAMPEKGKIAAPLPIVQLIPQQSAAQQEDAARHCYQCPLYLTAARAGALSSTGQSTNFVTHISLPIAAEMQPADFVLQGVAAICSGNL